MRSVIAAEYRSTQEGNKWRSESPRFRGHGHQLDCSHRFRHSSGPHALNDAAIDILPGYVPGGGGQMKRHIVFTCVLTIGLTLRLLAIVAYRPALVFYGDSYYYLANAAALRPDSYHPAGYSAFLAVISLTHNLEAVPIVQHAIGIVLGTVIYLLLLRRGAPPWLAALGSVPVLLDAYQIDMEQEIMSDALDTFLLAGGFVLLLWRPSPRCWRVMAAGAFLAAAALTRSSAIVVLIPAFLLLVRRDGRTLVRTASLLVVVLPILLAYGAWHARTDGSFSIDEKVGMLMYGRVAPIAVCSELPTRDNSLCDQRPVAERPGPIYYIFAPNSPLRRNLVTNAYTMPEGPLVTFVVDTIRNQPLDYARLVLVDTARYFQPVRVTNDIRDGSVKELQFPTKPKWTNNTFLTDRGFMSHDGYQLEPSPATFTPWAADLLHTYQTFGYVYGPILLLAPLLLGLEAIARRHITVAALVGLCGILQLLASSAAAQFDYRFLVPAEPFLVLAAALVVADFGSSSLRAGLPGHHDDGRKTSAAIGLLSRIAARATRAFS